MTNKEYTREVFVADRSGSMSGLAADMNIAIRHLLNEQADLPGRLLVDVIAFDTEVTYPYTDAHPRDVVEDIIVPRGGTALNDAVAGAIIRLGEKLQAMTEEDRPGHVIFTIITDGQENSSVEYKGREGTLRVKELIATQREKYGWEFLFLATGIDAFAAASEYGVARGQTMSFAPSAAGTQSMADSVSAYHTALRGGKTDYEFTEEDREEAMEK